MAVRCGWEILSKGGQAIDAVEAAVNALENDPVFDAGTGSLLNLAGEIGSARQSDTAEMDAMMMDGTSLKSGAVACIKKVKNPVSIARRVGHNH